MSAFMTAFAAPARAHLLITVDKTTQQMTVAKDGEALFVWPVSTGAAGYDTPNGDYTPFRMEKDHFSKEWDDAPMPHSVFFTRRGHAIHGSTHKSIGRPASHGCVRLEPKNAALLFDLVKQEGLGLTRIVVTGDAPGVTAPAVAKNDGVKRNAPARAATGFDRSFSSDDVTASIEPRMVPPADVPRGYYAPPTYEPRAYAPPREDTRRPYRGERRAVIGYRDTRTGQVYYYDRPRYEVVPPRYYYER
ncbi:MAG TPA: L,D-transpeptidase [Pseudolabrys sp.]|nr:L,D-transpeptidase [Pseudolabrys sp.]